MKITTLNLFGRFDDWQSRQKNIIQYLSSADADIIFFQEVVYLPDESAYTQVTDINKTLAYPYEHIAVTRLQTSLQYSEHREGQGLLSKYPIIKSETLVLRQNPEDHLQRIVQLVDIKVGVEIVKFANVQFAELPRHAGNHLQELLEILHSRGEHRIILGDFNIPNIDIPLYAQLWRHDYRSSSATPYISYPSLETRLDYILLPKAYTFTETTLSGDTLSDHRALTAGVALTAGARLPQPSLQSNLLS